ncbi:hypothetical protein I3760_13G051900 [Carya illinoinensis]|uniref:Fungal lipase-type domain-containing protein n=1 Tax=Carya illinoinensis TaxID=32201 RepID=A0A922AM26_CARIL|nr:hypothetical protein I3760_13G051900 [Carya illinoinensis]KAG6680657.1 hypothetical protein I3842_13G053400 [Carya illinoinensis]
MESIHSRVESWIRDQRAKILKVSWGPLQWRMRWPWNKDDREQRKKIQEEYERRKKQLHDLCRALKAESVLDLQDILCCMVLSECVYKRPAAELVRAVNKFKADFGGQLVSLERVQPSLDHVPHRYLLAEAGDTLFASFVGTKQYKDVMADANILQGAIFHEDAMEDAEEIEASKSEQCESRKGKSENLWNPLDTKSKQIKDKSKPAVHRGFLARAKGIPALELYRLAQKKKRKLVLCGHSLGGAVAALATLAILRVIAVSSSSKEGEKVLVKCITFSQPPVGNAALRDYVNSKGWHHYFKTYCIPEDLVPRILSPAYFHHYNAQAQTIPAEAEPTNLSPLKRKDGIEKLKENQGEQLVLGLGPVQRSFWRLSRLVPLESVRRKFNKYGGNQVGSVEMSSSADSVATALVEDDVVEPQSLEIQEGSDGISLKPISDTIKGPPDVATSGKLAEQESSKGGDGRSWRRVPYLPSYVPFGQVRSVIAELRERLQSHSMKSYRSRFQRIYDLCMSDNPTSFLGIEQLPQFPHLQQWLGLSVAGAVELGHIVESPVIRTATSIAPLGWNGLPGEKNGEPLKVDITGFRLHLCTLVHAQVNGNWCSTRVESFPSVPTYSSNHGVEPELQKMRVLVGAPLRRPPKHQIVVDTLVPIFPSVDSDGANLNRENTLGSFHDDKFICPEGLSDFSILCTSDFAAVSKEVHVRTRRVRLLGLEGAGKTSLLKAILGESKVHGVTNIENMLPETDVQEGIAGGLFYCDSAGINLQDLNREVSRFRDELWMGIRDLSRKTDLIVLVHNLSHKIPQYNHTDISQQKPVLTLLLDEAKSLGIPWVLAITNKFSVSAHQQRAVVDAVVQAYQASLSTTGVINSCPYVMAGAASASLSWGAAGGVSDGRMGTQTLLFAPMNLVRRSFQKKDVVLPVEGVTSLCQLVHRVLRSHEEASFQELSRDRLLLELARERAIIADASADSQAKASSLTSAAVGASLGAGLGLVLAIVMGAASALRKP